MHNAGIPGNGHALKSFITGLLVSAGGSLFFCFGISIIYKHLSASILFLAGLTILCFVIFRMNNKYGRYLDVNDVFRKTISFHDFKMRDSKWADSFTRFIRPFNPYVGALGVISGLVSILLVVPSLIIYSVRYPDPPGMLLIVAILVMNAGICLLYYAGNKEEFSAVGDKIAYVTGVLLGAAAFAGVVA